MNRTTITAVFLMATASATAAQTTSPRPEFRPFAGANIPTGPQRDLFSDAPMMGAQLALEIKPSLHLVGQFGWIPSQTTYPFPDNDVNVYTYDLGIEVMAVQPLGGTWELKPFIGIGGGARTYAYSGMETKQTCGSGYATLGTEFQLLPWALRLEARNNLYCYQSPFGAEESETRYDLGLTLGLAYHFR